MSNETKGPQPPAEAQPVEKGRGVSGRDMYDVDDFLARANPPPSAPVWAEHCPKCNFTMSGLGKCVNCEALAQQTAADKFVATFRCESNGIVGTTNAPIHSVSMHDDGVIEVVIDHWPEQPAAIAPVKAVEEALQRWLDWCDEHGEQPEAASGARIALRAAALASQQGGS